MAYGKKKPMKKVLTKKQKTLPPTLQKKSINKKAKNITAYVTKKNNDV